MLAVDNFPCSQSGGLKCMICFGWANYYDLKKYNINSEKYKGKYMRVFIIE